VAAGLGLRIPEDLSVVGVDDPPSAGHLSPALTTLRQPLVQVGKLAARGLFDAVGEQSAPVQRTMLRAELVVRGSTGRVGLSVGAAGTAGGGNGRL
jgi:DNA-binding LacI/PurR family transcriptional regulator